MATDELKRAFFAMREKPFKGYVKGKWGHLPGQARLALADARKALENGRKFYNGPRPDAIRPAVFRGEKMAHVENPESAGFRFVGRVEPDFRAHGDPWDSSGRTGWHTDPHGDTFKDGSGLCYGVVYALPGRAGRSRLVAGYEFGGVEGGPSQDLSDVYESDPCADEYVHQEHARHIARIADSMAEYAAEQEREYQTAWQAGSRWQELGDEIAGHRRDALAILAERREAKADSDKFPTLCAAISARVASILDEIKTARGERAELASGDYGRLCFWPGDSVLQSAFNEGAGESVI